MEEPFDELFRHIADDVFRRRRGSRCGHVVGRDIDAFYHYGDGKWSAAATVRLASSHVKPRGGIAKRCTLSLQLRQRRLLFAAVVSLLLVGGLYYFRRMERTFADVV